MGTRILYIVNNIINTRFFKRYILFVGVHFHLLAFGVNNTEQQQQQQMAAPYKSNTATQQHSNTAATTTTKLMTQDKDINTPLQQRK